MLFVREKYERIITVTQEYWDQFSSADADFLLDRHTDSPHEGGCTACWRKLPCLTAAALAWIVLNRRP